MRLECHHVFFLLLLALSAAATVDSRIEPSGLVGGWTPIENLGDPHVLEIAKFAVTEYNKQSGASLNLEKVIKGDTQVVAGTNYRLILSASSGGSSGTSNYEAIVWEKPWQNFKSLTSFKPVHA
ncbi:hypothetical protein PIB30_020262 [Stylosanthes scabra]|uniref:Cystatin domain-containing protein n=1 Tax=Stylosanthes scabra TaxID=79078 RepID=A0ABU6UAC8_9FABA|nr:hypothetical protein [Stylosanthes scabra]